MTTTKDETTKIKSLYSSRKIYETEELNEYIAMRDVYRNYEIIENSRVHYQLEFFLPYGLLTHKNGGCYFY